ncbi:MAG: TlpA family protein disulfide reductase [Candidatus Limnocylindria bacterium]
MRVLQLFTSMALAVTACSAPTAPSATGGQVAPDASRPATRSEPAASSGQPDAGTPDPLLARELTDVRTGERFTLAELAADQPVLVETMAIWCTTCLAQQREVVRAHGLADFASVGIDVDPNERAADLAKYADREGFDWRFVIADAQLVKLLTDRFGFAVTNPPSTPTFVVTGDGIRALEFGRVRSAEELAAELAGQ